MALSSSRNTDDECLDHLCCRKGGTLNVLMQIEPFELALGEVWCLIALRVCTWERWNASQRIATGLLNLLRTTRRYCPFVTVAKAVKMRAVILEAYMHNWHFEHALTWCIYASLVIKGLFTKTQWSPMYSLPILQHYWSPMYSLLSMQHYWPHTVRVCYITHLTLQNLQFCLQLTKAYVDETSCNQLFDWFCYVFAHQDRLAWVSYFTEKIST